MTLLPTPTPRTPRARCHRPRPPAASPRRHRGALRDTRGVCGSAPGATLWLFAIACLDFPKVLLAGARLRSASLQDCTLVGADFAGADLSFTRLEGADLSGANLAGAGLKDVTFGGVRIGNS